MKKKKSDLQKLIEQSQEEWAKWLQEAIYKTKPITDVTPEELKKGEYK